MNGTSEKIRFLTGIEPGSKEWKNVRRQYVTGTDIAPLMLKKELKPKWMASRSEIYLEKIGELPDKPENAAMRRGRAMEAPTAQRYAQRMGYRVYTCPMLVQGIFAANIDRLVEMPGFPACTPDGQTITAHKISEIKTSSTAWGESSPVYYYGQPEWYMGFLPECESADIACWFGDHVKNVKEDEPDDDFAIYTLDRNQSFIDEARAVATEFMEKYVRNRIFPEPESEEDCRIQWAVSSCPDAVTATQEIENAIADIHRIDEKVSELKSEREDKVSVVMRAMGDHALLKGIDGKTLVTWKSTKPRKTTDWQGLCGKYLTDVTDEQIAEFTKFGNPTRPFKLA